MTALGLGSGHLVIASHNPGKVAEIAHLVEPRGVVVYSAADAGVDEPEETGDSFAANARLKALNAARQADMPALADDSGLTVSALDGRPGIHSARWAGPEKDFSMAMALVHHKLSDKADWSAAFVCVLAVAWPDGACRTYEGRIEGTLVWPPRGDRGFGYDPMFQPEGHAITFGEMDPDAKHRISHRARAFRELVADLFGDDGDGA